MFSMYQFPDPEESISGMVCATDDLSIDLLVSAYLQGIFPWYREDMGEAVVWWSPDPRFVLFPEDLHIPKRLKRFLVHNRYTYTMDVVFDEVVSHCASGARPGQKGTWIGPRMRKVYGELHRAGLAHSIEVWHEGVLVGGFYGVLIGCIFYGESMFSLMSETAKSAFVLFVQAFTECGGKLIDSQVYTANLARFGARNISRNAFLRLEKSLLYTPLSRNLNTVFAEKHQNYLSKDSIFY